MTTKIISYSFHLLFFLTPLIWIPLSYELFEYNKMMFVYGLTVIISGSWMLRMINEKKLILKRTPLDIPLMLFLLANIISTVLSIDTHISIWGYYSRSNGGLLSLIAYLLLYYALVSNFKAEDAFKFLKSALFGGLVVSFWAIPEHFKASPSCLLLTGRFDANCWVQDVAARVFATLGQPNWLAAYLAMLIPPALYFLLTAKSRNVLIAYLLSLITLYTAFTFTYSRGAMLGLIGGVGLLFLAILRLHPKGVIGILGIFFVINLIFGFAFTDFKLFSKFSPESHPSVSLTTNTPAPSIGTQLENGGTESGKIRLIVWKGALEIFKHYPIFGSGVETFAYAYYQFRPLEHNLVSEWDFLYNKAHNEFLNYLATTGLVGFTTYMAVILTFIIWSIKKMYNLQCTIYKDKEKNNSTLYILHSALLASYTAYLVQNFFSFSVVVIALFFYLFPALAFLATDSAKPAKTPWFINSLFRHSLILKSVVIVLSLYILFTLAKFWAGDIFFAEGEKANEAGSAGKAYKSLATANKLNPNEPFYKSELSYAAASAAILLDDEDASASAEFKIQAFNQTSNLLSLHPHNISFYRTAIRGYYILSTIDETYLEKTIETLDKAISLAPTDPKLTYNKAIILEGAGFTKEASLILEKTVELKSNYKDARLALGTIYFAQKEKEKAIEQAKEILKYYPSDTDAAKKVKEWSR